MTSGTEHNTSDVSPWLRPWIGEPANVLLLGSRDEPNAGEVCQRLLTTASYRDERILAIGCGDRSDTWLDRLEYSPANLTIEWCGDAHQDLTRGLAELRAVVREFVSNQSSGHRIVYVDGLSPMITRDDSIATYGAIRELTATLRDGSAVGFVRLDPMAHTQREVETIATSFDFTAELTDDSDAWRLVASDRRGNTRPERSRDTTVSGYK